MASPPTRPVAVAPDRLAGWVSRFAAAHGGLRATAATACVVTCTAADGAVAVLAVPFPPLRPGPIDAVGGLVAHACAPRRVGVLLVRLGGYAAGVFQGQRLESAKVGSRYVHGRSAAGGQSQRRFARRREGQARQALAAAADTAVRILVPAAAGLDAVVLGGDRGALRAVLADPRLAPLAPLVVERTLDVPDPRQRVLLDAPGAFRAVSVQVTAGSGLAAAGTGELP